MGAYFVLVHVILISWYMEYTLNMYFWVEVLEGLDLQSLAEGRQSGTVHCHPLKVV